MPGFRPARFEVEFLMIVVNNPENQMNDSVAVCDLINECGR